MTPEEANKEFNKAANEMTAEQELKKFGPDADKEQIDAETKEEYDRLAKELAAHNAKFTKPAEPLAEQSSAPAPPETPSPVVNVAPEPQTSEVQVAGSPAPVDSA